MSVGVIYSTEGFFHKSKGQVGRLSDPVLFDSLEKAKAAPLPEGFASAFISVEDGYHTYSKTLGWESHGNARGTNYDSRAEGSGGKSCKAPTR